MDEPHHPFVRLPPNLRRHPDVVDAWLTDLSSRPSKTDKHGRAADDVIPMQWRRMAILGLAVGTATGIIKPEVGLKLIGLALGIGG